MTRPTTTGKAQDLITFTRSTAGTALAKISYGEELVTNGDFASDSDWAKQVSANWTISGGKLNGANSTGWIKQNGIVENGKAYKITVDAIVSGGSFRMVTTADGSTYTSYITSSGSYVFYIRPLNALSGGFEFIGNGFTGSIDNISVKEVLYDQPDGTLQLFNHPINKPRIEYDAEGNCLGLLVEEARTNLVTQSEFASGFLHYHITLTRNQTASPDTNINAGSAVPTAVNTEHYLECVLSSPSSGTYTQSVFVKANGYSKVALTPVHIGADQGATSTARFDLTEGTSTQIGSAVPYISNLGNGWYRIAITYTATGTVTNHRFRVQVLSDSYGSVWQANGADGIYVYGAQLETGSFPTSYIPTSGSAVTRSADVASLAVSEFGYNQDQGTVVVTFSNFEQTTAAGSRGIVGTSSTGRFAYINGGRVRSYDGTSVITSSPTVYKNTFIKSASTFDASGQAVSVNGTAAVTGSFDGTWGNDGVLYMGRIGSSLLMSGYITSLQYYPLRLSNAQLQALTIMTHYLKFESEEQMSIALSDYYDDEDNFLSGNHEYTFDIVGLIYRATEETETDEEGNEYPVMEAIEGWHVNYLGDLPEALVSYELEEPSNPARVFAGHQPVQEVEQDEYL